MKKDKKLRVLILEDNHGDVELILHELKKGGYEPVYLRVDTAKDMRAAINKQPWDLIIADYTMPQFNAIDGLKIMQEKGLDLPYIIVSGTIGEDKAVSTMISGAHDYLMKDNLKRLVPAVSRELQDAKVRLERRQAEESLADERKWLDVTLHSIGDGVITTNANEDIILINKVAENFTGYLQRDAIGESFQNIFHIKNKKTGLPVKSPISNVLKTGKITGVVKDTVLVSKNGLENYISCTAAPIRNKENKIIGVVLIFRDINLRKKMEENLLKFQKIESLNILAGGIAHDFNNLLSAILGNISIAKMLVKKDGEAFQILTDAEESSLKARGLTMQLLTFTKTSAPIKRVISIEKVLKESVNFALRGTNVSCTFNIRDNINFVDIDESQINQVINNLVINAEQSMPKGGIIEISALNIFLNNNNSFHLKKGNYVKISVKDKGIGIPEENLEKIFDLYFTTKQKGSGLGLATSYSIIEKHNGQINVESHVGKGTTFYIYLPVSKKQKQKETKINKNDLKGQGKILVMDDETMVRKSAGRLLKHIGYKVEFAIDGKEAIDLYKKAFGIKSKFDAVIMDLTIPGGMGGKEAVQKIIQIDPDVRVVVSSGYSQDTIVANYKKYGFKGVINKPYTLDELSTVLKEVIGDR